MQGTTPVRSGPQEDTPACLQSRYEDSSTRVLPCPNPKIVGPAPFHIQWPVLAGGTNESIARKLDAELTHANQLDPLAGILPRDRCDQLALLLTDQNVVPSSL